MSWDDEDFDISSKVPAQSWEDEVDDEPLLESWDTVDTPKAPVKTSTKTVSKKKENKANPTQKKLDIDLVDDKTRRELLKQAELDADLNNAADLFDGLGVADEHPRARAARAALETNGGVGKAALTKDTPLREHPIFELETKQDYVNLRKALSTQLTSYAKDSMLNYSSSLAIDLIRDLSNPLSLENLRKVISTLSVMEKEKIKVERQARLAKSGGTSTGGAGKKKAKNVRANVGGSFRKDDMDTTNYDDLGDDDFM
ncbi:hypothetical protein LJB42_004052 [Komagataella kurtzmanii]|nr:hypothetical protein LJB42_004052 [Komagataella kurtzmanii]